MGVAIPGVTGLLHQPTGQVIDGSLKFSPAANSSGGTRLERTPGSSGNRRTWTWSAWVKRGARFSGTNETHLFDSRVNDDDRFYGIAFSGPNDGEFLFVWEEYSAGNYYYHKSTPSLRDNGWYHLVVTVDTTQPNGIDRVKFYANGKLLPVAAEDGTYGWYAEDFETNVNQASSTHTIGSYNDQRNFDGYMSQNYLIDGLALGPDSFGFTDPLTNTWRPKKFSTFNNPNNGTTWSSGAFDERSGQNPANAFNGNTSDYYQVNTDSDGGGVNFSGGLTGTLKVYASTGQPNNGDSTQTVTLSNGTTKTTSQGYNNGAEVLDFGFVSNITSIAITNAGLFYAFEVNEYLLVDGRQDNSFYLPMDGNSPIGQDKSGNGNDWTPVNFGGSVALDNPQVSGARPILNTIQGGTQAGVGVRTDTSATSVNNGTTWSSGSTVTGGTLSGATYGFDGSLSASNYCNLQATDTSTTANVTFTASIPNVTKVEVFVHSASSSGDTRGTCLDTDGVTHTSATLTGASQSYHTIYEGPPITLANVGWGVNQNGQTGTSSDGFRAFRVNGYVLKDNTSTGEGLVLALPLVGSANDVSNQINSGSTTKVVTVDGAVASSAFSNFYTGSFEFDGTDDDLTIPDSADFNFGTGDFTMEMWVYSDASQTKEIMGQRGAGVEGAFSIYHTGDNILLYVGSNGSSWDIVAGDTIATNVVGQWTHIAIVRNGNNFLTFQNGVHVSTTVDSGTVQDSSSPLSIGSNAGTFFFDGKLSDIRIYKGVAKYTSDFVVPSTSPDILPDTPSGVSGGSKLTKITDGAVSFDGNGDYLSLAHNSDFDMYNSIYTWDLFFYTTDLSSGTDDEGYGTLFSQCTAGSNVTYGLGFDGSGNLSFKYWNGSGSVSTTATTKIGTNRWYHVAIVKDTASATSGNTKIFLDGKLEATTAVSGTFSNSTDPLEIGADRRSGGGSYDYFQGQISNLRAVKGTALYTSDFTPPTAPLTDVTNTKLLCCQSNVTSGAAAVSPNISGINDGTVWSDYLTTTQGANSRDFYTVASYPPSNLFDGDTSTIVYGGWTDDADDNSDLIFSPPSGISVSSKLEVYVGYYSKIKVNGADYNTGGQSTNLAWVTVSDGSNFTGTLTELILENTTNANVVRAAAIRIDDSTILVDPVTANGDAAATNFNPFTTDINTVRGQETGYATLNPLDTVNSPVLSNGNLDQTETTAEYGRARSTLSFDVEDSNGYYAEITATGSAASATAFGIIPTDQKLDTGATNGITGYKGLSGRSGPAWWTVDGAVNGTTDTGLSANPGDVLALAVRNGSVDMYINGLFVGTFSGLSGQYSFITSAYGTTNALSANFGQKPFKFPPPEGFQPLNTANVRPEIVIARPDQYVGVTTYVGNESSRVINCGFKPDFVWIKEKSGIYHHAIYDSVRGPLKSLSSSRVDIAEQTETEGLNSFVTNGFSFAGGGPGFYYVNRTGGDYVAWTWKAGGNKNTFNVDDVGYASAADAGLNGGSGITLTGASVGTKQGFSILRYTGGESGSTLSHGLTQAPDFWIIKNLSGDTQGTAGPHWYTKHKSLPGGKTGNDSLFLNLTNAQGSNGPHGICKTSGDSLFEFVDGSSNDVNWHTHDSAATYICYAWHDVPGLQKFGKYTGNASTDGPYVELGFRPAVVIYKRTDNSSSAHWVITDSERDPFNLAGKTLGANLTDVEATSNSIDFLSNGFKIRASGTVHNASGGTYIYMAWAEAPTVDLFGGGANAR